jgi:hypothetical protein
MLREFGFMTARAHRPVQTGIVDDTARPLTLTPGRELVGSSPFARAAVADTGVQGGS